MIRSSKHLAPLRRFYDRHQRVLRILIPTLGSTAIAVLVAFLLFYFSVTAGLPNVNQLTEYDPAQTSKIFSRDGKLVATLYDENRTYVEYKEISPIMIDALVAVEDRRYFEHSGVDLRGILRAAVGNLMSAEVEQGASTLTMQLARALFLSPEQTYSRKLREAVLAHRMERALSKEKVLELYLNEVYFGAGAYGIDAASSLYFAKQPDELELWEAALLAGLVQAPSAYSPVNDLDAAQARQEEVLQALIDTGKITEQQAQLAQKRAEQHKFPEHSLTQSGGMLKYPYFTTYAIQQLSQDLPENYLRRGGLKIVTTLDTEIQKSAEHHLQQILNTEGPVTGADAGAVVVLDNLTGDVVAMVGGPRWSPEDQFNRAWQAMRQPGSAFKMFVYAAALEAGFTPEQEFADTESVFNPNLPSRWQPANSDGKFMGPIPMRSGLQFSRNVVAAKVLAHVGPERVISLAHSMGVRSELPSVISLALGAGEVTPLQMARAYSVLPNGGILRPNQMVRTVTDQEGKLLLEEGEQPTPRVLSQSTATVLSEMLRRVVTGGTGTAANLPGTFVAGKTGTTDQFIDAWFVGFTPHHTIAVWVGRDDNRPMNRVYGGTLPARIFREVARDAMQGRQSNAPLPGVAFSSPLTRELCWDSTYLATDQCGRTYQADFRAGQVPSRRCPMHRSMPVPKARQTRVLADGTQVPVAGEVMWEREPEVPLDNPRDDREVVTPASALIPYDEAEPALERAKLSEVIILESETGGDTLSEPLIDVEPVEVPTEEPTELPNLESAPQPTTPEAQVTTPSSDPTWEEGKVQFEIHREPSDPPLP